MYQCQLYFPIFCATSALGISWQHLKHPNLLVRSIYQFHLYFHVRIILYRLGVSLPHETSFSKIKDSCIKSAHYSICDDYGVNTNKVRIKGDWFYTTAYANLGDGGRDTPRSPPDNLTRWIIAQSKGFMRKGIEKVSRYVRGYVYLVLN